VDPSLVETFPRRTFSLQWSVHRTENENEQIKERGMDAEVDRLFMTESDVDGLRHWALNMSIKSALAKNAKATLESIYRS
jgi:hypothetical protein